MPFYFRKECPLNSGYLNMLSFQVNLVNNVISSCNSGFIIGVHVFLLN
ncbi:hypothetical protein SF2457T_3217 [Shigella flexneri 2a str. 2457T]|nr:hypothetical protein SF2457T_3217 [Shigella flexneri 2a str. 2457T]